MPGIQVQQNLPHYAVFENELKKFIRFTFGKLWGGLTIVSIVHTPDMYTALKRLIDQPVNFVKINRLIDLEIFSVNSKLYVSPPNWKTHRGHWVGDASLVGVGVGSNPTRNQIFPIKVDLA